MEDDEAGRLAAFRAKFGRAWDANVPAEEGAGAKKGAAKGEDGKTAAQDAEEEDDNLLDLISTFGQEENQGKKK